MPRCRLPLRQFVRYLHPESPTVCHVLSLVRSGPSFYSFLVGWLNIPTLGGILGCGERDGGFDVELAWKALYKDSYEVRWGAARNSPGVDMKQFIDVY